MIRVEITSTDLYGGSRPINWTYVPTGETIHDPDEEAKVLIGETTGYLATALKFSFVGGPDYLRRTDIRPMMNWSEDQFAEIPIRFGQKAFINWMPDGAGALYEYGLLDFIRLHRGNARSSITFFPLEAYTLDGVIDKISARLQTRRGRDLNPAEITGYHEAKGFIAEHVPPPHNGIAPGFKGILGGLMGHL